VPLVGRLYKHYTRTGTAGSSSGRPAQMETRRLRMTIDHATGALDGVVLEGRRKGARLSALPVEDLIALLRAWTGEDEESARLMETFLDHSYGDRWRTPDTGRGRGAPQPGAMTPSEAYQILGLDPGAGEDEIIKAHRRLMQKLHPDRGGSNYLAAKLNQAKKLLLGR